MPRLVILLACLAAIGPPARMDANALPENIRITAEYIEAPHPLVTQVMAGAPADFGPNLHARMRELVQDKKARIIETSILSTRSGQKTAVESHMEHIFPTAFQPIYWIGCGGGPSPPRPKDPTRARPFDITAFETRNVGSLLEVEPFNLSDQGSLELRLTGGLTKLLRYETWFDRQDHWGDTSIRQPIYESLKSESILTVLDGKFSLVNLLTPTNKDGGPDTSRKILLFVRADIITIGS